jgi:hypothetical protein
MNRSLPAVAAAAMFFLVACGSASAAKTSSTPSPAGGNGARNGASGQLVQVNGQTLIVTGPNGDITVTFTSATTFTKTSIATLADITKGTCIVANGQKSTTGAITATSVRISPKTATGCASNRAFAPTPAAGQSPRPTPTPRPTPSGQANFAIVTGEVTAAGGTSVTVLNQAKVSQTITVASAATITKTADVTSADLQNGQCLRANGTRNATGDVQATSITITPAGPSGTCSTGGGRGPGFGGPPGGAAGA